MKNEEKYITREERNKAFSDFCGKHKYGCHECPLRDMNGIGMECAFAWLALEADKEKPLPCPCCGGEAKVSAGRIWAQVECRECGVGTKVESTEEKAIAKWNRRTPMNPTNSTKEDYNV